MKICFLLSWTVTEMLSNGKITPNPPIPFCNAVCVLRAHLKLKESLCINLSVRKTLSFLQMAKSKELSSGEKKEKCKNDRKQDLGSP